MKVDVIGDSGAGDPAEVPTDVVALRPVDLRERPIPWCARRWTSSASSSVSSPNSPTCRFGATMKCPEA